MVPAMHPGGTVPDPYPPCALFPALPALAGAVALIAGHATISGDVSFYRAPDTPCDSPGGAASSDTPGRPDRTARRVRT